MDRVLLQKYQLSSIDPIAWEDASGARPSKHESKYFALEAHVRSPASAVQDESDPLGTTSSVLGFLKARDQAQRASCLVGSKTFDPHLFLKQIHAETRYGDLMEGAQLLESTIRESASSLKLLVEKNFDEYVSTKTIVDTVYEEMVKAGLNEQNGFGVQPTRDCLARALSKLMELYQSVLDNRTKGRVITELIAFIEQHQFLFDLPAKLEKYIETDDSSNLRRDYLQGRRQMCDAPKNHSHILEQNWTRVENVVFRHKNNIWQKLSESGLSGNYMDSISQLLDLGIDSNPICHALSSEYERLASGLSFDSHMFTLQRGLLDGADWSLFAQSIDGVCVLYCPQILEFHRTIHRFLDGSVQKLLPVGFRDESRRHLVFEDIEYSKLSMMSQSLTECLLSTLSRILEISLEFCVTEKAEINARVLSERFISLYADIQSRIHPLTVAINSQATELGVAVLNSLRARCTSLVCSKWQEDCQKLNEIENWANSKTDPNVTSFPEKFLVYEDQIIKCCQKLVVALPSKTEDPMQFNQQTQDLVRKVQSQFIKSLHSMLNTRFETLIDCTHQKDGSKPTLEQKILFSISNLHKLQHQLLPQIIRTFETSFKVELRADKLAIEGATAKILDTLFANYVDLKAAELGSILNDCIHRESADWRTIERPVGLSNHISQCLLFLTVVYLEVSQTSPLQLQSIISALYYRMLIFLEQAVHSLGKLKEAEFLQLAFDLQFAVRILVAYSTPRIEETVKSITHALEAATNFEFPLKDLRDHHPEVQNLLFKLQAQLDLQFLCFKSPSL